MNIVGCIFFSVVAVLAVLIASREWRVFRSVSHRASLTYTRKRLRRRLAGLCLLLIVSLMLLLYHSLGSLLNTPARSVIYLGISLIGVVLVFWLVIIDIREMGKTAARDHQKLVLDSLESLRTYFEQRKEKPKGQSAATKGAREPQP